MATTTTADGVELYYELTEPVYAEVEASEETVVFVGEAGYGVWQWGWQHERISHGYETLVWDFRGTGRSEASPGPYSVTQFASDLEAVLSAADTRRVHLVGAGLGGMVALRHAREYSRVATLTLFNTAASGDAVEESELRALHSPSGDETELRQSLSGAFSDEFLNAQPMVVERICEWRSEEDADVAAFDAQVGAALAFDAGPLYELTVPALVCHGLADPVIPVGTGERLSDGLPRGTFEAVEGRHLCFIEHSLAVTDRVLAFLEEQSELYRD